MSSTSFDVKLLGPTRIHYGDTVAGPTAHKVRQILALLALRAGEVVTSETLIAELWGENPPRSATTTTQTYIYQVRRLFDSVSNSLSGKSLIITHSPGYTLTLDKSNIDVHQFQTFIARAREVSSSDPACALRAVRSALSLMNGVPLVDVMLGRTLRAYAANLREEAVNALELRISLDIRRGMYQEVISELRTLTAEHPYRERFYLQLMLAFYLSNRRSEALGVYHEIRQFLQEDMGVEPSQDVRRLQNAILLGKTSDLPGLYSDDPASRSWQLTSTRP